MNNYGNNIILASQAGCDLVLITEEGGGGFPVGSKVFYDSQGQTFDVTNTTDGTGLFENNQNIGVDWETDLPNTEKWASMFAGSDIESVNVNVFGKSTEDVTDYRGIINTFNNCQELKSVYIKKLGIPGISYGMKQKYLYLNEWFAECHKLETVYICFDRVGSTAMRTVMLCLMGAFKNCVSLKNITITHDLANKEYMCNLTGAFKGCKFGPAQLIQLLNNVKINVTSVSTIIGYDSSLVDPNVDKPEGSELTWAEAFAEKKWTVTWEAYVEPVENAPKMLKAKASPVKYYKLDEIPDEMVEAMDDFTVYVKDGKHYLMTSGDSVTAPGTDGTLLRDTEVENVVRAGSLQEAIDLLGVTLAEK